jgi:cell division protein FtsB
MLENIRPLLKNKLGVYYNRLLLVVLILLLISFAGDLSRIENSDLKIDEAQQRLNKLESERIELEKQVNEVNSEEFVEKQIRDKLNLSKEGEIVIVLPDEEILRKIAPKRVEEMDTLPDPNWKKWVNLFI